MNQTRHIAWPDVCQSNDVTRKRNAVTSGGPNKSHEAPALDGVAALITRFGRFAVLALGLCTGAASAVAGTLINPSVSLTSLTPGATNQTLKITFTTATELDGAIDNTPPPAPFRSFGRSLVRFNFDKFPVWWPGTGFSAVDGCSTAITIKLDGVVKTGTDLGAILCTVNAGLQLVIAMSPNSFGAGVPAPVIPADTQVEITVAGVTVPSTDVLSANVYLATTDNGGNPIDTASSVKVGLDSPNSAPTASSVAITGTAQVGTQLSGGYTYADADSDAQGTSTFRWVRNSVNSGVIGGTDIAGATAQNYTPVTGDVGKYLYFCVTPVASAGTSPGTEVCSSASSAVIDDDQDGVSPSIEDGVPNATGSGTGDGNGDSVPDSQQVHVASLPTASSGGYATIESVGVKSLTSVAAIAVPSDVPGGVSNAPYGAFSFTANGVADNASETFKLYLPLDNSITGALKKNRVTNRWDSIGSVSHTATRTIITFTLVNGGPYDADGSGTNGQIQDPIVPVMSSSTGPISIPTLSEWGMIILSGLLALGTFVTMRQRRV